VEAGDYEQFLAVKNGRALAESAEARHHVAENAWIMRDLWGETGQMPHAR